MFCSRCGAKNDDGMNFCEECGASLSVVCKPEKEKFFDKKRNKRIITIVIIGIIVSLCAAALVFYLNGNNDADYNMKIEEAQHYLSEMDYDKAETAYLEAIDIEPKKEQAYIELCDFYISQEKYDQASDVMEQAKKEIGRKTSKEFDSQVVKVENIDRYKAYYDLCINYQDKYGKGGFEEYGVEESTEEPRGQLTGLAFAKLCDFNNDGSDELILAYRDSDEYSDYKQGVWAWQDGKMVNILAPCKMSHGSDVSSWISVTEKDDTLYLTLSYWEDSLSVRYFEYDGSEFITAYGSEIAFTSGSPGRIYKVNGKEVSEKEYDRLTSDFPKDNMEYTYDAEAPYYGEKGEFQVDFHYVTGKYAKTVIADTDNTIEKLKEGFTPSGHSSVSLPEIPQLCFFSGAGAWQTTVAIKRDGSFEGSYYDSNMGDIGEGYPNGTVDKSEFSGQFTDIRKISDYMYSMKLDILNIEGDIGDETILDGIRYIICESYGIDEGKEYYLYMPGAAIDDIPEEYLTWIQMLGVDTTADKLQVFGLYSEGSGCFISGE